MKLCRRDITNTIILFFFFIQLFTYENCKSNNVKNLSFTSILSENYSYNGKYYYSIYIKLENNQEFVVSPNTILLLSDSSKIRADRVFPSLSLLSFKDNILKPIRIKQVFAGEYIGEMFFNINDFIAKNTHVKIINNILFLDSYFQKSIKTKTNDLPQVASEEYVIKYKEIIRDDFFSLRSLNSDTLYIANNAKFIMYKFYDSIIVDDYFLPKINSLYSLDNILPRIQLDEVLIKFRTQYPEINFLPCPQIERLNAECFPEYNRIEIYGGLIRTPYIKSEGLDLLIAHEVAHFKGGKPFYGAYDMSCEGQADFMATFKVLRNVYENDDEFKRALVGIKQFEVLNIKGYENSRLCNHGTSVCYSQSDRCGKMDYPCLNCRILTFINGYNKKDKPLCAGKPSGVDQE
jgi:hypothetical protein